MVRNKRVIKELQPFISGLYFYKLCALVLKSRHAESGKHSKKYSEVILIVYKNISESTYVFSTLSYPEFKMVTVTLRAIK